MSWKFWWVKLSFLPGVSFYYSLEIEESGKMNNIFLNQSGCYRECNNITCDATTEYSIFGYCDFEGTIYLKALKEEPDKIAMTLEIDISQVDLSTGKKTMEFTVVSAAGSEFEGKFSIAFEYKMKFPFVDGKFSYQLSMPSYEISKMNYDLEHESIFTNAEQIGPQQCNQEVSFKDMLICAEHLKWHKGTISVEFKLK